MKRCCRSKGFASTRGALPEVVGDAGLLLDLPDWLTVESRRLPERAEVADWITAIERLWDDAAHHQRYRVLALQRAQRWCQDAVAARFEEVVSAPAP